MATRSAVEIGTNALFSTAEVLNLLGIWRGASFACESATGFCRPSKGAPHGDEITCFAAHAGRVVCPD
jgi:hypothetical protein